MCEKNVCVAFMVHGMEKIGFRPSAKKKLTPNPTHCTPLASDDTNEKRRIYTGTTNFAPPCICYEIRGTFLGKRRIFLCFLTPSAAPNGPKPNEMYGDRRPKNVLVLTLGRIPF